MSHDYWFEARPFILDPGDTLDLHLLVGDDGHVELERALEKKMTPSFLLVSARGETDLLEEGRDGTRPVLRCVLDRPGLWLVVMERDFSRITLTRQAFMDYLEHEEIADDRRLLQHMGDRAQQRERYARSVKTLVRVRGGENGTPLYRHVFGHPYELILLDNPYALRGGGTLRVQVLRHGRPAPGKKVMAQHLPESDFRELIAVSDTSGRVTFHLPQGGEWLVRSLDLYPCRGCDTIDWESHWASFSFLVPQ